MRLNPPANWFRFTLTLLLPVLWLQGAGCSNSGETTGSTAGAAGGFGNEVPGSGEPTEQAHPIDWSDLQAPQVTQQANLVEDHPCFERVSETYADSSEELVFSLARSLSGRHSVLGRK